MSMRLEVEERGCRMEIDKQETLKASEDDKYETIAGSVWQ
jgi:hypothetical protein